MAENKTQATAADVDAFLAAVEPAVRRADALVVRAMMERLSGEAAVLWGPSIVGFGRYRYTYDSGRTGEAGRIGFAPRKPSLVIYLNGGFPRHAELMARLGKVTTGKCCLYVKRLADIDLAVLEELIGDELAYMRERYPE